jgi:hypothetical protein
MNVDGLAIRCYREGIKYCVNKSRPPDCSRRPGHHRFENEKTTGGPDSVCPWSLVLRQRFRLFYASRPAPRADGLKSKPHQKQKSKKLAKKANMSVPLKKDTRRY